MAHIPRERLCFDKHAELNFHQAMRPSGEPLMEITRWMVDQYPDDIREWIETMGGAKRIATAISKPFSGNLLCCFPCNCGRWAIESAPIDRATCHVTPSSAASATTRARNADVFVFGLGRIENLGSVSRLTFYSPRASSEDTGRPTTTLFVRSLSPTTSSPKSRCCCCNRLSRRRGPALTSTPR
jgi:hypothetical protein